MQLPNFLIRSYLNAAQRLPLLSSSRSRETVLGITDLELGISRFKNTEGSERNDGAATNIYWQPGPFPLKVFPC